MERTFLLSSEDALTSNREWTGAQAYIEVAKRCTYESHKMKHLYALQDEHDDFLALVASGFNVVTRSKVDFIISSTDSFMRQLIVIRFA